MITALMDGSNTSTDALRRVSIAGKVSSLPCTLAQARRPTPSPREPESMQPGYAGQLVPHGHQRLLTL